MISYCTWRNNGAQSSMKTNALSNFQATIFAPDSTSTEKDIIVFCTVRLELILLWREIIFENILRISCSLVDDCINNYCRPSTKWRKWSPDLVVHTESRRRVSRLKSIIHSAFLTHCDRPASQTLIFRHTIPRQKNAVDNGLYTAHRICLAYKSLSRARLETIIKYIILWVFDDLRNGS